MLFRQIFEPRLAQYAYLIGCPASGEAVVVDPLRDIDRILEVAARERLRIVAAAETHVHADFLSGVRELAENHGVRAYVSGLGGDDWTPRWPDRDRHDVVWLEDGDVFRVGGVELTARHTPGHTPEHLSFLVTDRGGGAEAPMGILSGDFVFVGSVGRPDLLETAAGTVGSMEPAARTLRTSLVRFLELPDHLQVWPGHGAGSACGKGLGSVPQSTVGYERRRNGAVLTAVEGEQAFVDEILSGQPDPPLYFARMKQDNRDGPPLLGRLPHPERIAASGIDGLLADTAAVVLDTRRDRAAFLAGHLPRSLHAPLDNSFPTIAGSFVEPGPRIVLRVEEPELEEAVRSLVRIGLDDVAGWFPNETIDEWEESGGTLHRTATVDFATVAAWRERAGVRVLDVRRTDEFEAGHIPGAIHVPHTRLLARRDEIPDGEQVLVHCASGIRATAAVSLLEHLGHRTALVEGIFTRDWPASERGRA